VKEEGGHYLFHWGKGLMKSAQGYLPLKRREVTGEWEKHRRNNGPQKGGEWRMRES